jgi:hypothetical protein
VFISSLNKFRPFTLNAMSHVLDLILPDRLDDPDMDIHDLEASLKADFERQRVLGAWLKGELPYEAALDTIADYGIDAHEWDDVIADIFESVLSDEIQLEDPEYLLDSIEAA